MEGFLRGAGLASLDACETRNDGKGDFYVAMIEKPGRATPDIVAAAVPDIIRKFPWPKSMRWGAGRLRWVRPLHSILCLFDGKPVEFEVEGIQSGGQTEGHRFLNRKPLAPKTFAGYCRGPRKAERDRVARASRRAHPGAGAGHRRQGEAGAGRGYGPAGGKRRAVRVAVRAGRRLRQGVPRRAGRNSDDLDEGASEVLQPEGAEIRQARQPLHSGVEPHRHGRRQGHHRGQRAGDPRAAVGCEVLLGERPRAQARRPAAEAGSDYLPREARHARRARRAHCQAGARAGADGEG